MDSIQALFAALAELQTKIQDAQAALSAEFQAGAASRDEEVNALKARIAELEAQVPPVGDKIYSQAEVDAMLAPLNQKISELQATVDAFPGVIEQKVNEAIAAFKAELRDKYMAQQTLESDSESGFMNLLT